MRTPEEQRARTILTIGELRELIADLPEDGEVWWISGVRLSSPAYVADLLNPRRDAEGNYLSCSVLIGDDDFWFSLEQEMPA